MSQLLLTPVKKYYLLNSSSKEDIFPHQGHLNILNVNVKQYYKDIKVHVYI